MYGSNMVDICGEMGQSIGSSCCPPQGTPRLQAGSSLDLRLHHKDVNHPQGSVRDRTMSRGINGY